MEKASSKPAFALEICIDSVASAVAAEQGGAQRVELCDYLAGGGTTPSAGMISLVRDSIRLPLHVLIRPRRGDFLYSAAEMEIMKRDIQVCRDLGADGVVIGLLTKEGAIDLAGTEELIQCAGPLSVTFHRAFDLTRDPLAALNDLLTLKVDRLLTSGQEATALRGVPLLRELQRRAAGKLTIMPGSGVNPANVREIMTSTGVKEIHASVRRVVEGEMVFRKDYPPMSSHSPLSEFEQQVADVAQIRQVRAALDEIQCSTPVPSQT
ncbi:copper homeostasis protein CutC [Rufibacter glacialis]|uniref:PF03932 family protein CutC n=1 Tax=Rufibacter glacialis TaxID=1259555 RepID=A0A5M8QBH9_9BACT|nr:copper homeostasis protein CutC [Rufibacter glacialis]KAA6432453.1 copper homeostasis protein CutC [Rufibacter glacialis]GGK78782.1 copper homeostasis protein CutC [Rufibacter glacialis]